MSVKTCKFCAMSIPAAAVVCPYCRKTIGMSTLKKVFACFIILLVGSCVLGQAINKLSPPVSPPQTPQTVTQPADNYKDVQGIVVRGKSIMVGDKFDDVTSIISSKDVVDQEVIPDKERPGNMFVIKSCEVDGKKFRLHLTRVTDPGPYKVIGIEVVK